jgi:hypothetical protein
MAQGQGSRWARWGPGLLGALALGAVGWMVYGTLQPEEGGVRGLSISAVSDQPPLGPDRFVYTARLTVEVSPRGPKPACLLVLDRGGAALGSPLALAPGEGRAWTVTASASALSGSSYGPLWLVALSGEGGCEGAAALVAGARGQERPLEAVAAALGRSPGWSWGAKQVFVHDKLP